MLLALFNIADLLLRVLTWIIILQVILSWLIAFNVINTSSEGVRRFLVGLERFLDPLYRPIRRIMPDFGGLDLSPVVLLLAISIVRMLLAGLAADIAI
ncbi:YggT family protein [Sphingomonas arenae]|uniref:YggT family protein n=1 Tax=Sphingomonas arenae TaxID=2812555 RepID=UPI001966F205|nr:YggT family protein [Sphingomonas arenae]